MKLAPQQLQDEAVKRLITPLPMALSDIDATSRIYASGKKAKRAIRAMQRNGWRYCKPTQLGQFLEPKAPSLALPRRRRRKQATGAVQRLVVFYKASGPQS